MIRPESRIDLLRHLPKCGVAAEIGVAAGSFAEKILVHNFPRRLYLVDCWAPVPNMRPAPGKRDMRSRKAQEKKYRSVVRNFVHDTRVCVIREDSIVVATEIFYRGLLDWAYIDSNHFYEHARKELPVYWDVIKPGGWMAGHDFLNNEWSGVKRAVEEFCEERGLELGMLTTESNPSWAIQKPM